jgi:hypothetical protein
MYCVRFEYKDGKKGICKEGGKPRLFENENAAADFAESLNSCISEELKDFFPKWRAELYLADKI